MARRWRPPVFVFLAMFGLIAITTLVIPNGYQSRFKVLVKNARIDPIVSLDQHTQGILYVDDVSEAKINTEIELLTSADVLREVVVRCHLGDLVSSSRGLGVTRNDIAFAQRSRLF